jgi:hypothetical protein
MIDLANKILENRLSDMVGRTEQSYVSVDDMRELPEWSTTLLAMLDFGTELLKEHIEHPTKPGYRRSDVISRIKDLESKIKDLESKIKIVK